MTSNRYLHARQHGNDQVFVAVVVATVTLSCVLGAPISDVIDGGDQEERWLGDESFYSLEYDYEKPQADGRELTVNDLCPPVPMRLPSGGCDVSACSSDRECSDRQLKCCYNGCVYTCLPEVKPPPYIDWIREPVRRLQFGQSWLVPGPNVMLEVMPCSTSPVKDDSDPLLCPHGYECSIDDVGVPAEGLPNRGHCVKVVEEVIPEPIFSVTIGYKDLVPNDNKEDSEEDHASLHACHLEEHMIILSGHSITHEGHSCLCQETELICEDSNSTET